MRLRARLVLGSVVAIVVVSAIGSPVSAGSPKRSEHQRIIDHWTRARMESARPRDFVMSRAGRLVPQPQVANATGQSWPTGGANGGGLIARVSGRVYFEFGANAYVCSGSVVNDSRTGSSIVLTAGHCVYDWAFGFASYWMFVPQADGLPVVPSCAAGGSPRGCWTATTLVAHSRFTGAGGFSTTAARYDYGFAVVGPGGFGGTELDADTTADTDTLPDSLAIAYSGVSTNTQMYAFGYPVAAPYNGTDLVYCSGKVGQDFFNANATWSMVCNMTGGASGGPWMRTYSESTGIGTLGSLNSYRYSFSNRMYGPKFTSSTQAVYTAANGGTVQSDVVVHAVSVP